MVYSLFKSINKNLEKIKNGEITTDIIKNRELPYNINLEWNNATNRELQGIKKIFVESFLKTYENIEEKDLQLEVTKQEFLETLYEKELEEILKGEIEYVVCKIDDKPIGFASCYLKKETGNVYLSLFVVHQNAQKYGMGRHIINTLKDRYSDFKGIELATRIVNDKAKTFYTHLNFVQEDLKKLKIEDHNPETYIGFELNYRKAHIEGIKRSNSMPEINNNWQNRISNKSETMVGKI